MLLTNSEVILAMCKQIIVPAIYKMHLFFKILLYMSFHLSLLEKMHIVNFFYEENLVIKRLNNLTNDRKKSEDTAMTGALVHDSCTWYSYPLTTLS